MVILLTGCSGDDGSTHQPAYRIHTFYYSWYGNPETDGRYHHWNHEVLPHWSDSTWDNAGGFPGGADIGANFYPELGCYSSNDSVIIERHVQMMAKANIGVVVLSWWGRNGYEDRSVQKMLDAADRHQLKVAFHIEPFYANAAELKPQLEYLASTYGQHPACYTPFGKPFYYVYDSYKLTAAEWQKLLQPKGSMSIRNTPADGTFIGLWVEKEEQQFFRNTGFDGFYTYFASDGFVYGSTAQNWPAMSAFARQENLMFIPCVGPGYIDTRIRPWNGANTKDRANGAYYEQMFAAAAKSNPNYIGITSFNEWHEGTQIEPAVPRSMDEYQYEDYGADVAPEFYLQQTKNLIKGYPFPAKPDTASH